MLVSRTVVLSAMALALAGSSADAQIRFQQVAKFGSPIEREGRFTGGREVAFSEDGTELIAAFYGSSAQLFDLDGKVPVSKRIGTSGDGEVGFVNENIAYTADWNAVRLWDTESGRQVSAVIPHELREDTIIHPAVSPQGKRLATRATMKSVRIWDVATRQPIGEQLNYESVVYSLRFSDDGEVLFVRAGGSLYALDSATAEVVAGPIASGWQFYHFAKQQKLITTEQVEEGSFQLVIRSTDEEGWPEAHRSDLPGRLSRVIPLNDNRVFLQATMKDYSPAIFTFSLDEPETRLAVESGADRAFGVVVTPDKQHWICTNIRDITCQRFGETQPVWQKPVPPSGYDKQLHLFDDEHFVIRDKQGRFGVYKVSDGSEVWNHPKVNRFSVTKNRVALCTSDGIEVWAFE